MGHDSKQSPVAPEDRQTYISIFEAVSHLRAMNGFEVCGSLSRIEIPSSVALISN
jgi:hypothetical protein